MIRTTQFDGTFELAFLQATEAVRSAGKGSNAIEIVTMPDRIVLVTVRLGEWVERCDDGRIVIVGDEWPEEFTER